MTKLGLTAEAEAEAEAEDLELVAHRQDINKALQVLR